MGVWKVVEWINVTFAQRQREEGAGRDVKVSRNLFHHCQGVTKADMRSVNLTESLHSLADDIYAHLEDRALIVL